MLKLTTDASLFRGPVVGVVSSGRRCSLWDGVSQWHGVCSRCRFYFLFCMRKTAPMLRKNVGAVLAFPKHVADTACAWDSAAAMFPCAAGVVARALAPHPVARLGWSLCCVCGAGAVFSPAWCGAIAVRKSADGAGARSFSEVVAFLLLLRMLMLLLPRVLLVPWPLRLICGARTLPALSVSVRKRAVCSLAFSSALKLEAHCFLSGCCTCILREGVHALA